MKYIGILVEGQTEEQFVQKLLNPFFVEKELQFIPTIVKTRRDNNADASFKGGGKSYDKIANDLRLLFYNKSCIATTTMFDLYGLPKNFPHIEDKMAKSKHGTELVLYLEEKWRGEFPKQYNFIPYLAVHEFEALLFTDPKRIAEIYPSLDKKVSVQLQKSAILIKHPKKLI